MGHFSEMRIAGCSTKPSDPLHATAVNPDCAKPLLTAQQTINRFSAAGLRVGFKHGKYAK